MDKEHISLFASLFKGREDVYARRWEGKGKSGYAPAYDIDWTGYDLHKAAGGSLKDYPNKQFAAWTTQVICGHLEGKEVVGIYPLLKNNLSLLAVVDFDEQDWKSEIVAVYKLFQKNNLPVYIERSRSGNGAHLWLFFNEPCPAVKSRAVIKKILAETGINLTKQNNSSFDRIIPNQDYHSGKGLGNLIALPFQKEAMMEGNTCFLDPDTLKPYSDQWQFLHSILKINRASIETLYEKLYPSKVIDTTGQPIKDIVEIFLDKQIVISRETIPKQLYGFLKDKLEVTNPNFFIRKATGQNTFGTSASSTLLSELGDKVILPRGFIGTLIRYCQHNHLRYNLTDNRRKLKATDFQRHGNLFDHQQEILHITEKKDIGVIVAPPGSGKTFSGLAIIAQKKQPALVIVHRRQLLDQWLQSIQFFLGIPKLEIGKITQEQVSIGKRITVAMVQCLAKDDTISKVSDMFGSIIIDECHHVVADTYVEVLNQIGSYYLYGLTATPIRKNKDEQHIFSQLGEIIYHADKPIMNDDRKLMLHIKDTDFYVPFNSVTDTADVLMDILVHDIERNGLIADDIKKEINNGRSILVLTERKAHIEVLDQFLKQDCEVIILTGDDTETIRKAKLSRIREGRFQVVLATGQLIGEGIDIDILDCLFLVFPFSFEGKLVQFIGRVQRSPNAPVVYDYRDLQIPYLEKMFQKRNRYYNKLFKSKLIQRNEEYLLRFEGDRFYIGSCENAYPISILDLTTPIERFKGGVVWKIRVLRYDEENGQLYVDIVSYGVKPTDIAPAELFLFNGAIELVKFRNVDTMSLLAAVVLKRNPTITVSKPPAFTELVTYFEKTIKVTFDKIRFENGFVSFPYYLAAINQDVWLTIPNEYIRPEFEAIKSYFPKILKTKSIRAHLAIKHNNFKALELIATSDEIMQITQDVIESVRFEFVRKRLFKGGPEDTNKQLLTFVDLNQADRDIETIFNSEGEILQEALKIETAKHYLQLKYLAGKHETTVLKLRFILQPFSFVFLLAGDSKYHIVWETLDTEEATYIWHVGKDRNSLTQALDEIEIALRKIREHGRATYSKDAPINFSKIIHDYIDPKKGFTDWKGTLEERLV